MLNLIICYLFAYKTFATNFKRRNSEDDEIDFCFKRYKDTFDDAVIDEFSKAYESFINPNNKGNTTDEHLFMDTNVTEDFSFENFNQTGETAFFPTETNEMNNNLIRELFGETATNFEEDNSGYKDNVQNEILKEVYEKDEEEGILIVNDSSSDIEIIQENIIQQKVTDNDVTILQETINISKENVVLHLSIKDTNDQAVNQTETFNKGTGNQVVEENVITNDNNATLTITNTMINKENMVNLGSEIEEFSFNGPCATQGYFLDPEKQINKDTVKMQENVKHVETYAQQNINSTFVDNEINQNFDINEVNSNWLSLDNFEHGEIDQQAVECILDMTDKPYSSDLYEQDVVKITALNEQERFLLAKINRKPSTSTQNIDLQEEISKHIVNIESIIENLSSEENLSANNFVLNNQFITPVPSTSLESSVQMLPLIKNEEIYTKIVLYIRTLIKKLYIDCYLERLNGIKTMINHNTQFEDKQSNNIKLFFDSLDKLILQLLDLLNLREGSKIDICDMVDFDIFNFYISDNIFDLKIYDFIRLNYSKIEKEIYSILKNEFLHLFDYFPDFPELMTLGSLINQGLNDKLLLFFRIIHMAIKENRLRLVRIRPIILFIIRKLFMMPHSRSQNIDLILKEKFICTKALIKRSPCDLDHSNFSFLMWEFDLEKLKSIKQHSKSANGYIYDITVFNIEHFRVIFLLYLYQHLMFAEYHNLDYERYKNLFEATITEFKCVFCMFNGYLELLRSDAITISNRTK